MTISKHHFSILANLNVEGVGLLHGSFSVALNISNIKKNNNGVFIKISAIGNSNAAKAAGSGKVIFWCTVLNKIDNKKHILDRKNNDLWVVGIDDYPIGSAEIFIPKNIYSPAYISVECGYIYTNYTGQVVPFPSKLKRDININKLRQ